MPCQIQTPTYHPVCQRGTAQPAAEHWSTSNDVNKTPTFNVSKDADMHATHSTTGVRKGAGLCEQLKNPEYNQLLHLLYSWYVSVLASELSCEYVKWSNLLSRGDPPPSMHVIAFFNLDHFLGRLLCSSGDVTHRCTTLMAEFHSKCDYHPLCLGPEHCVGWN